MIMLGKNMLSMSALSLYRNAVQFGMNVAIAAFVSPGEYGLVVFTTPFVVLIAMLTDLGMTSAITRAPTLSRGEAGAAMAAMTLGGAICALLLALGAYPLQEAIGMAGLAPVMIGMALVVVLSVAAATPRALLERQLHYGRIAAVEAGAIAVAAVIGLIAAWHGAGVWALVLYNLVNHGLRAVVFGWSSRRGLAINFRFERLTALLSFGGWVLATNLLNFLARNSDNLLIGAWLGAAAVGAYGLSYQFMLAPLMAITWPTSAILVSTLRNQDPHGAHAQTMVQSVLTATALLSVPAMIYLTFGLRFPVDTLLSGRWHQVPSIVAWLAPVGALQSIASYNGALLMVAGRARAQFALTVVNTLVLVVTFVLALPFGLLALVKAYALVGALLNVAFLTMIIRLTGLSLQRLALAVMPATAAAAAGLAAVSFTTGFSPATWPAWLVCTGVYGTLVLGTYGLLHVHVRSALAVLTARAPQLATGT
ncbi:oligosaccharide flippase family protein [Sphingomonas sp. PL-96]|uniref:oligosaccharide flippase family protein n=1 Tax=Sphingomonas sp. PL-96 TaxID=2887201 RepID=UPI001E4F63AF|nr:oligosaccharide flippase family protein [Sphingomonas sp. PL-96]MCC2976606.1 oligosaccharide flippase family protein [Sphingomonas sp. PL-96]